MTDPADPHRRIHIFDIRGVPDRTIHPDYMGGRQPEPTEPVPDNGAEATDDSWQPTNLAQLGERPPEQPTLGGLGIAYPGKRHVYSGPQESAKTLVAYTLAIQVARTGGTAIIIDFEMGEYDARDRLTDLGATPTELAAIPYLAPVEPATNEHTARLIALAPQVVLIDAAAGAYDNEGLDDNKRSDVERFTRLYVRSFWQAGIATIVLDHVVKNADGRGKYAIGSERKVGGADVHLGFEVVAPIKRGTTGIYKIVTHKDRGGFLKRGRLYDLHLTSDPDTHHITCDFREVEHEEGETFRPTVLMERASQYLQGLDEPTSFTKIKESITGEDKFIAVALERLVEEGYASEEHGPRNARLITHKSLFTGQERPLRPSIHAETDAETAETGGNSPKRPLRTPASPLPAGDTLTPASPSIDAGVAGVTAPMNTNAGVDVFSDEVQRLLDDDKPIPF